MENEFLKTKAKKLETKLINLTKPCRSKEEKQQLKQRFDGLFTEHYSTKMGKHFRDNWIKNDFPEYMGLILENQFASESLDIVDRLYEKHAGLNTCEDLSSVGYIMSTLEFLAGKTNKKYAPVFEYLTSGEGKDITARYKIEEEFQKFEKN